MLCVDRHSAPSTQLARPQLAAFANTASLKMNGEGAPQRGNCFNCGQREQLILSLLYSIPSSLSSDASIGLDSTDHVIEVKSDLR